MTRVNARSETIDSDEESGVRQWRRLIWRSAREIYGLQRWWWLLHGRRGKEMERYELIVSGISNFHCGQQPKHGQLK